jgi:hypothetical protein
VTATSVADTTESKSSTVVVNPAPSITTTSLPNGTVGTAYSQTLQATGGTGTLTWTVALGSLPANLSLSSSGTISGTPSATGTSPFTVKVTDSAPTPVSAQQPLSITISTTLSILTTSLPNGVVGVSYSASVVASGGTTPYTWSLTAGTLPAGLTLNTSTGAITGIPTTVGTSNFTVTVTDSTTPTPQVQNEPLSISIVSVLAITTTALPNGSVGTAYSQTLAASGGTPPYTWSLISGALPAGLSLSSSGVISGTPTAAGTATFTVKATDSTTPTPQTASQPLSITINGVSGGALTITTTALAAGVLSVAYTSTVAVSGGTPPYTWSISSGSLPAGLTLNTSTGVISGTPTGTAGPSTFTVTVTDSTTPTALTQSQALSITINTAVAACSSSGYEAVLSGPYAFTLSGFNAATGFLAVAGAFTADGSGNITAGEADTNGVFGAQSSSIITSASSYSVGSDDRGCATIATSFGTFTTRFALGSLSSGVAAKGRMIEFDPPTSSAYIAVGQILQQTAADFSSGPSGSYVYGLVGWDPSVPARMSVVGVLTASSGAFTNMNEDVDDGGTLASDVTGITGTYTSFDTYGRATATFSYEGSVSTGTLYMVSASKLLYLQSSSEYLIGEIDQQTVPTGGFTNSSLNGLAVVYFGGIGSSGNDIVMGLFNANGSGSAPFTGEEDDSGTVTAESMTCTYTVASNGRTTLDNSCTGPVLYLAKTNTAFFLDMSPGVDFGEFTSQAAGPFTNAYLDGTFFAGDLEVISQSQNVEVGSINLDGNGGVTGTTDSTSTTAQNYALALTDTYSINSDGTFTVGSEGTTIVGAVISSSKFILVSHKKSAYPSVMAFSQ